MKEWLISRRPALLFALVAFLLVMVATSRVGLGITSDGVNALAASNSLLDHGRLENYDGSPYVLWPPLQPLLLTLLGTLFGSAVAAARVLNALLYALMVLLFDEWIRPHLRIGWMRVSALFFLAFSVQLFNIYVLLLSEPLFITLMLLGMLQLRRYMVSPGPRQLLLLALITAFAMLQRYVGVTLLGAFLLVIIATPNGERFGKRTLSAVLLGVLASLPLVLWLLYTESVSGQVGGERYDALLGFGENLWLILERLSSWVLPTPLPEELRVSLLVIAALLAIPLLLAGRSGVRIRDRKLDCRITLAVLTVYLLFLLVAASTIAFSRIDDRFLAVVLPQVICMVYYVLYEVWNRWSRFTVVRVFAIAFALLWPAYGVARVTKYMVQYRTVGIIDYRTNRWIHSELIARIGELDEDLPMFSNQAEAIWYYTGHKATFLPHRRAQSLELPHGEWRLAWFVPNRRYYLLGPEELRLVARADTLASCRDGVLLLIHPADAEQGGGERNE